MCTFQTHPSCPAPADLPLLKQLLEAVPLLTEHPQLTPAVAYVLIYEILFGQGLREQGPAERAALRAKAALKAALRALLSEAGAGGVGALLLRLGEAGGGGGGARAVVQHPRWARVNTLRLSVKEALVLLRGDPKTAAAEVGSCWLA